MSERSDLSKNLVQEEGDSPKEVTPLLVLPILSRCGILVTGVSLGFITLMPNIMMSDPGTPKANRAATVGLLASLLFATGGVVGCVANNWWYIVPGAVTQVVALALLS